jgi:hypothetical protein
VAIIITGFDIVDIKEDGWSFLNYLIRDFENEYLS